jgi:hypothetical protein
MEGLLEQEIPIAAALWYRSRRIGSVHATWNGIVYDGTIPPLVCWEFATISSLHEAFRDLGGQISYIGCYIGLVIGSYTLSMYTWR